MGHGPCGFGDDRRVPGIGFCLAWMQVRDPAHRQPREVAHGCSVSLGDRDGQRTDGRGLIHDHEDSSVRRKRGDDLPDFGFVLRQGFVVELLPGPVQGHRVVAGLADVQAKENVDAFLLQDHDYPRLFAETDGVGWSGRQEVASTLRRTHCRASISDQPAAMSVPVATPPPGSWVTGGKNHAGTDRPTHPYPASEPGYEKGNGGGSMPCLL